MFISRKKTLAATLLLAAWEETITCAISGAVINSSITNIGGYIIRHIQQYYNVLQPIKEFQSPH